MTARTYGKGQQAGRVAARLGEVRAASRVTRSPSAHLRLQSNRLFRLYGDCSRPEQPRTVPGAAGPSGERPTSPATSPLALCSLGTRSSEELYVPSIPRAALPPRPHLTANSSGKDSLPNAPPTSPAPTSPKLTCRLSRSRWTSGPSETEGGGGGGARSASSSSGWRRGLASDCGNVSDTSMYRFLKRTILERTTRCRVEVGRVKSLGVTVRQLKGDPQQVQRRPVKATPLYPIRHDLVTHHNRQRSLVGPSGWTLLDLARPPAGPTSCSGAPSAHARGSRGPHGPFLHLTSSRLQSLSADLTPMNLAPPTRTPI